MLDQGEKPTRVRCLMCMCWHEPDQHPAKPAPRDPALTGQVSVDMVPDSFWKPEESE